MWDWVKQAFNAILAWFKEANEAALEWVLAVVTWLPKQVAAWLAEGLVAAIHAIPVPQFLLNAPNVFAALPPGVVWFANMLAVPEGVAIVMTGYAIRFLIRRIPLIG